MAMSKRFFRYGELHLVILVLLSERALHGYELMGELSRLFGPAYQPSPGSVYPAVKALTEEGLLSGESADGKVRYRTTAQGAQAVDLRRDELMALEERTGVRLDPADDRLERSLTRFVSRVRALAGRVDPDHAARVIDDAAEQIEHLDPHPTKG
jgi:DNA-binding PadR family transcriptional regulator